MSARQRILIVDDEPDFRSLMQDILEQAGYETTVVGNGESALQICRERPPDLILLDDHLPDADGAELCQELQALSPRPNLPIILCSAARLEGQIAGASAYIKKPFELRALLALVEKLLLPA